MMGHWDERYCNDPRHSPKPKRESANRNLKQYVHVTIFRLFTKLNTPKTKPLRTTYLVHKYLLTIDQRHKTKGSIFHQIDATDQQHLGVCISSPFEKECDHLITMTTKEANI
jgi:hypothetical protein